MLIPGFANLRVLEKQTFEVLTAALLDIQDFWNVTPSRLVNTTFRNTVVPPSSGSGSGNNISPYRVLPSRMRLNSPTTPMVPQRTLLFLPSRATISPKCSTERLSVEITVCN
jgi:hypothetical protein